MPNMLVSIFFSKLHKQKHMTANIFTRLKIAYAHKITYPDSHLHFFFH